MKRDNRIPGSRKKRANAVKIIPNKKNISSRKKVDKGMVIRAIGSLTGLINFLLKFIIRFFLG